jgi:DNA-directed RNA polymerase specialized sigma24 family protein
MNPPREDESAGQEAVHAELREVLRLRYELKLGYQQIGRSCAIGVSTVHKYLKRAEAAGLA